MTTIEPTSSAFNRELVCLACRVTGRSHRPTSQINGDMDCKPQWTGIIPCERQVTSTRLAYNHNLLRISVSRVFRHPQNTIPYPALLRGLQNLGHFMVSQRVLILIWVVAHARQLARTSHRKRLKISEFWRLASWGPILEFFWQRNLPHFYYLAKQSEKGFLIH